MWTERGKKLLDGFAGLAVVNVGHGRREIAEAIAEQTVRLAYYPTTRQFSNRPAAQLAEKLAALTPGDLDYSFHRDLPGPLRDVVPQVLQIADLLGLRERLEPRRLRDAGTRCCSLALTPW